MIWLPLPIPLLCLCLSFPSEIRASRLISIPKRDSSSTSSSSPPPPATLFVPLTLNGNRRYTMNVSLPTSSNPNSNQTFAFALTTSTGYSTVAAEGCATCGDSPPFSPPSVIQMGAVQDVTILDGGVGGPVISQTCNILLQNGSQWSWVDQSFILANESNSIFASDISGVMGLGTNSRDGTFNDTIMAFWLKNNPGHQNFSYGLALNPPPSSSSSLSSTMNGGTLHWLAPDEDSYEGEISWKTLLASNSSSSSTTNTDSFVEMDSWVFSTGQNVVNVSDTMGNLLTVVDPLFPDIVFPQYQARAIYETIPGSSLQETISGTIVYSLPCSTTMQLNLTFGSVSAILTEAQLVRNLGNSTCVGVLEAWASENATDYLLGASLISNIYLIFQGSNSSSSYGFANRKSTSSTPTLTGASIAGVVLGSLAFLISASIATVLIMRWRRRRQIKRLETYKAHPFPSSPAPTSSSSFQSSSPLPPPETQGETANLITMPLSPPSDWLSNYVFAPGDKYNRDSKRNSDTSPRRTFGQLLGQLRLSSTNGTNPPSQTYRSSTQTPMSQSYYPIGLRNNEDGLFIQVLSPPSLSNRYTVEQQQELEEEIARLLQSNDNLPPYRATDPTPDDRNRI